MNNIIACAEEIVVREVVYVWWMRSNLAAPYFDKNDKIIEDKTFYKYN